MKQKIAAIGLFSLVAVCCGCSSSGPDLPKPGFCRLNGDCVAGENCVEGRCQDIYHPRSEIKNY